MTKVVGWLQACANEFDARAEELDALDRILGDGDHGSNMRRGFAAARTIEFTEVATTSEALRQVGMALVSNVGGASGPLFGTFFLRAGANWPSPMTTQSLFVAVQEGLAGVTARGKAEPGDMTMVDALAPVVDSLQSSAAAGEALADALARAAAASQVGRDATRSMVARRGRAALRAEHSIGVIDPGAVSMSIIVSTAAQHLG